MNGANLQKEMNRLLRIFLIHTRSKPLGNVQKQNFPREAGSFVANT